ncbi:MAG: GDSL-type esterase/lipase family protein [Pseudomonadales bacterium]|jgi:hypothetical protein|nr:GDSL-type esterase/lipase family protein [Pseudomonadales bacterium]MDP6472170.1 GDSL-type esterase/lipase family protein [Pseudomonadales bacterium]MDP6826578.1 GDSL-type esterase/lipase family protein [Pseudomonadales bacterium]MDP6970151.1 GDSL-type esterase/lipase family protein [Pseudomonadales bacterium]
MKKLLIGISIALNAIVLAIVIWAGPGGGLMKMFGDNFIRPGYERLVSQYETLGVAPGETVFLGDSITDGGRWAEWFPARKVRNRGIGGDTTAGVLARLDQVSAGHPARVFLLIGTNDLALGVSEDIIVANTISILDGIKRTSPETELFVQSVLPRAAEYRGAVEALNRTLAAETADRATWVDLYPLFLDTTDGSIKDEFSNDELHLHGAGYALWRETLIPLFR